MKLALILLQVAFTTIAAALTCRTNQFRLRQNSGSQNQNWWTTVGTTANTRTLGFSQNRVNATAFRLTYINSGELVLDDINAPVWYLWAPDDRNPKLLQPRELYPRGSAELNCTIGPAPNNLLSCTQLISDYTRFGVCSNNNTAIYLLRSTNRLGNIDQPCRPGGIMNVLNSPSASCVRDRS